LGEHLNRYRQRIARKEHRGGVFLPTVAFLVLEASLVAYSITVRPGLSIYVAAAAPEIRAT
jgi:hypothetical protein